MAHHYAIRTFDETAPVVRGGATAACQAAGNTLATVVPPDWRLIPSSSRPAGRPSSTR